MSLISIRCFGTLVMPEMGRRVHDDPSDLFHQDKRPKSDLVSPEGDQMAAVGRYGQAAGTDTPPKSALIPNMTDLLSRTPNAQNVVPGHGALGQREGTCQG